VRNGRRRQSAAAQMVAVVEQGSAVGDQWWGEGRRGGMGAIYRQLEAVRGRNIVGGVRRRCSGESSMPDRILDLNGSVRRRDDSSSDGTAHASDETARDAARAVVERAVVGGVGGIRGMRAEGGREGKR
jgi:hypothetical protein